MSKRGYPEKIIEDKMKKKNFGEKFSAKGVPFFVTYHSRLNPLGKIILENLNLYVCILSF